MPYPLAELVIDAGRVLPVDGVGGAVDPDEMRRRADEVLSRAEFNEPGESFLDHALGWLGEQFSDLFFRGGTSFLGDVFAYLLIAALGLFVAWVIYKSYSQRGGRRVKAQDTVTYGTDNFRGPEVWLAEADALAVAGDYRGALRCRHQALIASWILHDAIDHVVGRTARECHDAASDRIDADVSRRVVDAFNGVWYGGDSVDDSGYARFAADCDRLTTAGSGRRARVGANR